MSRIPIFVMLPIIALAFYVAVGGPGAVQAQQPADDAVVLDKDGCAVEVNWIDGLDVSQRITVETIVGAVVTSTDTITLNDTVGNQSATVDTVTAAEGTTIRARLYVSDEIASEDVTVITNCPTATPTATPTSTATSVPATATPTSPPATATPVPPTPTPIVITNTVIQERVVTVEVPRTVVISPPSTGDGGLVH